jgi:hypothetical protein
LICGTDRRVLDGQPEYRKLGLSAHESTVLRLERSSSSHGSGPTLGEEGGGASGGGGSDGGDAGGGGSDGGDAGGPGGGGIEGPKVRQKHCLFVDPMPGRGSVFPKRTPVSMLTKPFLYQHGPWPEVFIPTARPVVIIISMVVASIQSAEFVVSSSLMYLTP